MAANQWDIQEPGTRALLRDCEDTAAGCEPAKDSAQAALNALETALMPCPELADAVDRLRFDVLVNDMTDIMARCSNAVQGTRESVDAYAAGDREMADSARRAASIADAGQARLASGAGRWMVQ
ncbi:MAG: DUF6507 family protein [Arthrobacter sp.]|jgi:hypothetical protein